MCMRRLQAADAAVEDLTKRIGIVKDAGHPITTAAVNRALRRRRLEAIESGIATWSAATRMARFRWRVEVQTRNRISWNDRKLLERAVNAFAVSRLHRISGDVARRMSEQAVSFVRGPGLHAMTWSAFKAWAASG